MFESDISANSVSKTTMETMESAGFVTPRNKGALPRKPLFTDRAKVALGDTKNNMRHLQTPSSDMELEHAGAMQRSTLISTPFSQPELEHSAAMQPSTFFSTPFSEPELEHAATLLSPTQNDCPKRAADEEHTDEIVMTASTAYLRSLSWDWNKHLMLDGDTYNLIFIDGPNVDLYPPEPESEPDFDEALEMTAYLDADSTWDFNADNEYDEYDFPEVELSL
ncbi:hypothetical protein Bhyg_06463 [Pseudolycoriella hygida]|uniref:Uncharacterized protein n=1 Tax=Pseudolycoriella hygida TaxID=35572 RepID=A0A9Q0N0U7_9DIPT|nr:hypothetical protein Bhyg_06463 [Pseudolycoriella hygida]